MRVRHRLAELRVTNFKAFERFTLPFGGGNAYLVGPNNAGKSTLLAATRTAAHMVRIASRLRADDQRSVEGVLRYGHTFSSEDVALQEENLPHEFEQSDSCLDVRFAPDSSLTARWPISSGERGGFFYTKDGDVTLRQPRDVRRALPTIGVVPLLAPLEPQEAPLTEAHVRKNLDTQLASRHFRNQLRLLEREGDYDAFLEYVHQWTPELQLGRPQLSYSDPTGIDVFYTEPGGRHPREIFWAGDGIQVWVQLLLHLWRQTESDVVILDEPEVFLHPDLQRRLVDLLEAHDAQTIMATHSAEIVAEAAADAVLWISRHKTRAVRAPKAGITNDLADALGSAFNLRLARALKARAVVFVEGDDIKILRIIAANLGLERLSTSGELAAIPLEGFTRWDRVEQFKWLVHDLLDDLPTAVVLDRDYRQEPDVDRVTQALGEVNVVCHVWERHELENYLLEPRTIARLVGMTVPDTRTLVDECAEELRTEVLAGVIAGLQQANPGLAPKTAALNGQQILDDIWGESELRRATCPGKELRSRVNDRLQAMHKTALTDRRLAHSLKPVEMALELRDLLRRLDALGV